MTGSAPPERDGLVVVEHRLADPASTPGDTRQGRESVLGPPAEALPG